MPYVTKYKDVTKTYEKDLGYEKISTIRPKFVFFEFTGLRPNTPHWLFFNGKDVTKWANTSYSFTDYQSYDRNHEIRSPGDRFKNATQFPGKYGGATNGGSGSINTDSNGTLSGLFYIQSNNTTSFPTGRRTLLAIDISKPNRKNALSYAQTQYFAVGEYELFTEYQVVEQEAYEEWVDPPPPPPPPEPEPTEPVGDAPTYTSSDDTDTSNHFMFSDGTGVNWSNTGDPFIDSLSPQDKYVKENPGSDPPPSPEPACVIATYADSIGSELLDSRQKKKAEIWCLRTFHDKWWGEAIRRGYRYLGRKAIANGTADQHFQEFIDYVDFGSGKKRTIKTGLNFVFRTAQFMTLGLTVAKREK